MDVFTYTNPLNIIHKVFHLYFSDVVKFINLLYTTTHFTPSFYPIKMSSGFYNVTNIHNDQR